MLSRFYIIFALLQKTALVSLYKLMFNYVYICVQIQKITSKSEIRVVCRPVLTVLLIGDRSTQTDAPPLNHQSVGYQPVYYSQCISQITHRSQVLYKYDVTPAVSVCIVVRLTDWMIDLSALPAPVYNRELIRRLFVYCCNRLWLHESHITWNLSCYLIYASLLVPSPMNPVHTVRQFVCFNSVLAVIPPLCCHLSDSSYFP